MLRVEGVTVRFGDEEALDDVSLDVGEQEIVALLGPSGCGKSTLLRVVAGLQLPDAGRVLLDGSDLADVAPHERGIGLMFQDPTLFPHRDVGANVGFGPRLAGMAATDRDARVAGLLELVGLAGFERRDVATLSGGEAQRVALARALAPTPGLLLLDEPFGSLDRPLRDRLVEEIPALLREVGAGALHVTHDHDEAFAVADRVVVMGAGRVVRAGAPEEVWADPRSEAVARFLGHHNVVHRDGRRVLIRADAAEAAPDGELVATVRGVRFRRGRHEVEVATDDGTGLTFDLPHAPPAGATLRLRLDPDRVVVLDG